MKPLIWIVVLIVQVIAFGWIDAGPGGPQFENAGGPGPYFGNYFTESVTHSAPMLLIALGFFISAQGRGIDFSLAAMAALLACLMSRFPHTLLWTAAIPAAVAAALMLGAMHGLITARLRLLTPIITLALILLYRTLARTLGATTEPELLDTATYAWLNSFVSPLIVILSCFALLIVTRSIIRIIAAARRGSGSATSRTRSALIHALAALAAMPAAMLWTAKSGEASPNMLTGAELPALVIILIAGTRPFRGGGNSGSLLLAALNLAVFMEGLGLHRVNPGDGLNPAAAWRYGVIIAIGVVALGVHGRSPKRSPAAPHHSRARLSPAPATHTS